jgi:hypothetical protein
MTHNFGPLTQKVRGNVFLAGAALSLSLLTYEKLIHGRQSPYNRFTRWRKRVRKEKCEGDSRRPRRYNAREDPANWTIVQVPDTPQDSKPKRRRRKSRKSRKKRQVGAIVEPEVIHVTEEPGLDAAELAEEAARKRRAAWERWF